MLKHSRCGRCESAVSACAAACACLHVFARICCLLCVVSRARICVFIVFCVVFGVRVTEVSFGFMCCWSFDLPHASGFNESCGPTGVRHEHACAMVDDFMVSIVNLFEHLHRD